jgi:IS1 family transposase
MNDNPNEVGDFYTFIALDSDTKVIPAYRVGKRDFPTAQGLISDLSSQPSKSNFRPKRVYYGKPQLE